MIEVILLACAAFLVVGGYVTARFVPGSMTLKVPCLFGLGLLFGALWGTTYTHAFDILWWWKGAVIGLLLVLGGLLSRWRRG